MSSPWHYRGTSFNDFKLRSLRETFQDNWNRLFPSESDETYLITYVQQKREEHSYRSFHQMVQTETQRMSNVSCAIEAVLGGNSVRTLAMIVAALLNRRTLLLLNPNEGEDALRARIRELGNRTRVTVDPVICPHFSALDGLVTDDVLTQEDAFILVPTSGSTGTSKLVRQSEKGVLCNVDALIAAHRLEKGQIIATSLPVFHVNALEFSFFCTLFSDTKFVLWDRFDLRSVHESLIQDRPTILSLVPPLLRLLEQRLHTFADEDTFSSVRYVVSAASPLSVDLVRSLRERSGLRIRQGYGLSETVNFSTLMPDPRQSSDYDSWMESHPTPSIGTAIEGNEVAVLNPKGEPVAEGQEGEIAMRGINVMLGYRGSNSDADFTTGWFRTGDLGMWKKSPQGESYFFITGRIKEIVKRGSETIGLRDVDDAVLQVAPPGVDVISVGIDHPSAGEEIGLVLKVTSTDSIDLDSFAREINARVNPHLRPRVGIVTKEEIRTASGKAQRWKFKRSFRTEDLRGQGFFWLSSQE